MKKHILTLLLLSLGAWGQTPTPAVTPAADTPVEVKAEVDKTKVEVGQSVHLTIDLLTAPDAELTAEGPEKYSFAPFEVMDASRTSLPAEGGRKKTRYSFKLAGFEEGKLNIPPATFPYRLKDKGGSVQSQALGVEVDKVPAGKADKPGEIRDLKAADLGPIPLVVWAAGALALVLLGLALRGLRKMLRRKKEVVAAPPLPPFERAIKQLVELERERLPEQGLFEPYYDRLTATLRDYLGWRYGVPMLERTTSEIMHDLRQSDIFSPEQLKEIKLLLEEADLVKFAKYSPFPEICQQRLALSRELLEFARPPEPSSSTRPSGPPPQAGRPRESVGAPR